MTDWLVEAIPDDAVYHMRVHRQYLHPDGSVRGGCFRNRPDDTGGMTTDWNRYATPHETRERARTPADNAVIALDVGRVHTIPDQVVIHSPVAGHSDVDDNRAHTDVRGSKEHDPEVRRRFQRIASIVLPLGGDG